MILRNIIANCGVAAFALALSAAAHSQSSTVLWKVDNECKSFVSPDSVAACVYARMPEYRNSDERTKAGASVSGYRPSASSPIPSGLVACSPSQSSGQCLGYGLWNSQIAGTTWAQIAQIYWFTVPVNDIYHSKTNGGVCYGRPIFPLTGSKRLEVELDVLRSMPLRLTYDTRRKVAAENAAAVFSYAAADSFGPLWDSSLHKKLIIKLGTLVHASRGGGAWVSFVYNAGAYKPDADVNDRLTPVSGGWRYVDSASRAIETYDSAGKLASVKYATGALLNFTYSDASTPATTAPTAGLLIKVEDHNGRSVQYAYEQPAQPGLRPRVIRITAQAGETTDFSYDTAGNLNRIAWPDSKHRDFLYESSALPWALTGVMDENDSRVVTYGYDTQGRATSTQAAGGVDHYTATYGNNPRWRVTETFDPVAFVVWRHHEWLVADSTTVTLPNGVTTAIQASAIHGSPKLTSQTQPAGSGCAGSTSSQTFDANANVASRDDFNGNRACFVHDLSRNLETTRVEALATSTECSSVTPVGASLPTGSRKTSSQWHPDWRMQAKVAAPGRITTYVYNGQPDPFAGNAVASCAPTTATLPDGKRIAVLCKKVEQATTDADGAQGLAAALQPGVPNRVWQWTYNSYGHVLTERDPLNNQTTNVYYTSTATDYTVGDLQTSTNAAGHVTSYPRYNKHGKVLQVVDANGIVTDYTYDLRQRLKTVTTGGQTTSYDYDAVGQLKKVTQPDGSYVAYDYDAAHRLIAVSDPAGNRIDYTLDNAGNRTAENVKDPSGALKRQLARAMDALGRVQQTTGRE